MHARSNYNSLGLVIAVLCFAALSGCGNSPSQLRERSQMVSGYVKEGRKFESILMGTCLARVKLRRVSKGAEYKNFFIL